MPARPDPAPMCSDQELVADDFKPGTGKKIVDPRKADCGNYTDFCGCFCVKTSKANIM